MAKQSSIIDFYFQDTNTAMQSVLLNPPPIPDIHPFPEIQDADDYIEDNPIHELPGWSDRITVITTSTKILHKNTEKKHTNTLQEDPNSRTLAEVAYSLFDWQTRHKASNAAASGVWDFTSNLLPEDNTMGDFGALEKMLKVHRDETVIKVECCRNMCVAFRNPTHPSLAKRMDLRNAHRTVCPVCAEPRWLQGTKTPVRVFYYLPIKFWLQDLFAKADLVPHMANDLDPANYPDGHVRR